MDTAVDETLRDFRAVYRAHYGLVWHALFRLGVPPDALEDAVQDVFVVAYRRREDYEGTSTKAWLYGIARRVASNLRRSQRRRAQRVRAVARARPRPTTQAGHHEVIHSLDRYLSSLRSDDRELFILSELEGMTGPEIAEARGRKLATIYTRIRKLRQDLDADLELDRVRKERPQATAYGWAVLLPSLGATTTKAAGATAILGSSWFLGSLGLAGVMVVTTTVVRSRTEPPPIVQTEREIAAASEPVSTPPPKLAVAPPVAARDAEPTIEPEPVAPTPAPKRTAPRVEPDADSLAEENALLEQAQRAVATGDARVALALTNDHAKRFSSSAFADLRTAVRIDALCELGNASQARGEAAVFLRRRSQSPVADRIRTRVEKNCAAPQENPPEPDNPGT